MIGLVGTLTDVTELKTTQAALQRANDALRAIGHSAGL
ncbi:hypothetical protein CCP3SC1_280020 [Gammaproteobacteria bacterium]